MSSNPSVEPRASITLTNTNQQPVYVMSLGYKPVLVMATPDANWKNRVNGAHEAASYLAAPNRPAHLTIEGLTSLDQNLKDPNVLSATAPPENQPIPAQQSSELLLVYNGQVIEVPFTISYGLNSQFDNGTHPGGIATPTNAITGETPTADQAAGNADTITIANNPLLQAAVAVGLLLIGYLLLRRLNSNK